MKQKIFEILNEVIDTEKPICFSDETDLSEAGLTSIKFIQFIVKLEETFSIEILDSDLTLQKFKTVKKMFETLSTYISPEKSFIKKVLVSDCDNVLWQGIAGEEPLSIGQRESEYQSLLQKLYNEGVLLCLCSKNEPEHISEAFAMGEMKLTWEHFIAHRINRKDKASNLRDLAFELNLSLESFVFVDDSNYEIGLIQNLLPEVTAIPADGGNLWIEEIRSLFSLPSKEERNRTELYREQKNREQAKAKYSSAEEYNRSLQTVTICKTASEEQIPRLSELSLRTNQCNLSLARYTEEDLRLLIQDPAVTVLALSASDQYGDMGIVGGAVLRRGEEAVIEGFYLSCRVFDRGFEEILLSELQAAAGNVLLAGILKKSAKNKNYHNFYQKNGVKVYEQNP